MRLTWRSSAIGRCALPGNRVRQSSAPAASPRRGLAILELTLVLPILGIVLMALLEVSLLFLARSSIVEATRAGARCATRVGATQLQIENCVLQVLSDQLGRHAVVEVAGGEHSGEPVTVGVRAPMLAAAPDLLWPVGWSLKGRDLYAQTTMIKE